MRSQIRLPLALLATLVAVVLIVPTATARPAAVKKVGGLALVAQDWYASKLKVRWAPVAGATYQVRWGYKTSVLPKAKIVASRAASMTSPALSNRCIPWYFQVRALKAGKAGPWSGAKRVVFKNALPNEPKYDVSPATRTRSDRAQVTWAYTPYAAKYRLHWSPKPYGNAPTQDFWTPWYGQTARSAGVDLKPVGPGDQFLNVAYGNPTYAQLQYFNGCSKGYRQTTFFPMLPKPNDPGDGNPLRIGSYNVENMTVGGKPTSARMEFLAFNIGDYDLDVLVLQEADDDHSLELTRRLAALAEPNWALAGDGSTAQQILYRSDKWSVVESGVVGSPKSTPGWTEAQPIPTPWALLAPKTGNASDQNIFVVGVHLAERAGATDLQNKVYANRAATALLKLIGSANRTGAPVIAAGDFKGNFNVYCTESSSCPPEGQPTMIRGGFYDASAAVTRVGDRFSTVNQHAVPQQNFSPVLGPRADFILLKGFDGSVRYVNAANKDYGGKTPSDHNLIFADVRVPRS